MVSLDGILGKKDKEKPSVQYTAQATSPIVNGDVKLTVDKDAFIATGVLDAAELSYAIVNSIEFEDYVVTVKTDEGDYVFSRMGNEAQPFYDTLCEAYNNAVLRAFFVSGSPAVKAAGDYRFTEEGAAPSGSKAPVYVYENCIVSLPPNFNARRIPLCFVSGFEKSSLELTLKLNTGENYTFAKMGYETDPFTDALEKNMRTLREKTIETVKDIDPTLNVAQTSQITKLIPEGASAQMGQLASTAPSFAAAVEAKIAQTRAADTYNAFKELCDPAQIWVGFKKNDAPFEEKKKSSVTSAITGAISGVASALDGGSSDEEKDPYLFWMVAPSPDGQYAAVEFAVQEGESAATFVYRTNGDFPKAAAQLNRALEATSFKREVIRLSEEELRKPENADYYMAAKRTASLQYIRTNFVGRVIHSNPETWKNKLTEMWGGSTQPKASGEQPTAASQNKFCNNCGAKLQPGVKFCGDCGTKL
jgi:hypothetical protein